jgi:hypothetical protein
MFFGDAACEQSRECMIGACVNGGGIAIVSADFGESREAWEPGAIDLVIGIEQRHAIETVEDEHDDGDWFVDVSRGSFGCEGLSEQLKADGGNGEEAEGKDQSTCGGECERLAEEFGFFVEPRNEESGGGSEECERKLWDAQVGESKGGGEPAYGNKSAECAPDGDEGDQQTVSGAGSGVSFKPPAQQELECWQRDGEEECDCGNLGE